MNMQALTRICAIMIYKGSCGGNGRITLSTKTRVRFWSQALPCDEKELLSHIKSCRILAGFTNGVVGDGALMNMWNYLIDRNAMSCKNIFNQIRSELKLKQGE